nr:Putative C1 regulatory protein [Kibdelosporangium sp. MJ126-NF4]
MGFTQEALAAALRVSRITVSRWERGTLTPQPRSRHRLAQVLKISLETLDTLLPRSFKAPDAPNGEPFEVPRSIDLVTIADLRQQVQQIDELYDRVPSTSLLAEAGHVLGHIGFLRGQAATSRAHRDLRELEAEAETLMGQLVWDASQRRDHQCARQHFDKAVQAAQEIKNAAAAGHALLRKSYIALYGEQDAQSGLALTRRAADATSNVSNILTGLALLHTAEAHAMLGNRRDCEAALSQAETQFATASTYDVAGFLFSSSQFNRMAGSCYLFLGLHQRAQAVLETTASSMKQRKSRAIVLGNLSLARLRLGELHGATDALHEAIDVVEQTRGGGGLNVVFDAGRELRPWRSEQVVDEVYDRLLSLMTTA